MESNHAAELKEQLKQQQEEIRSLREHLTQSMELQMQNTRKLEQEVQQQKITSRTGTLELQERMEQRLEEEKGKSEARIENLLRQMFADMLVKLKEEGKQQVRMETSTGELEHWEGRRRAIRTQETTLLEEDMQLEKEIEDIKVAIVDEEKVPASPAKRRTREREETPKPPSTNHVDYVIKGKGLTANIRLGPRTRQKLTQAKDKEERKSIVQKEASFAISKQIEQGEQYSSADTIGNGFCLWDSALLAREQQEGSLKSQTGIHQRISQIKDYAREQMDTFEKEVREQMQDMADRLMEQIRKMLTAGEHHYPFPPIEMFMLWDKTISKSIWKKEGEWETLQVISGNLKMARFNYKECKRALWEGSAHIRHESNHFYLVGETDGTIGEALEAIIESFCDNQPPHSNI
jgi:hypothetical protein